MLVLLPPSETKSTGGDGAPMDLASIAFPELLTGRERAIEALVGLSARPRDAARRLGLGPRQIGELERNVELRSAPTQPAIERYTGVLYDALDVRSLRPAERARASERIAVCSALFGMVRADDMIPAYRLSAGSTLPRLGSMAAYWKPKLSPVLHQIVEQELVVDLRSGAYRALAPVAGVVTVQVLTERADGSRSVVSHFNKATKGELARLLVHTSSDCTRIEDVLRAARRGGLRVEQRGELALDVITAG